MKAPELCHGASQPPPVSAEQTVTALPALSPEAREALITFWAEIFAAEIRELSAITVGSPSGSHRTHHV